VCVGLAWAAASCADPLDVLGQEEEVSQRDQSKPLQDDSLADKNPTYDAARTLTTTFDGCSVTLNLSASVTRLSIVGLTGDDQSLDGRVFPTRGAALAALGDRPTLPSMEVVNGALKPFNDGLYAAVELAAEDGSGAGLIDKQKLFTDLLSELVTRAATGAAAEQLPALDAGATFAAAQLLGGQTPNVPAPLLESAQQLADAFDADAFDSTPIGFYTWTPELSSIFRRDRFLQARHLPNTPTPSFGALAETALVLNQNADVGGRYGGVLNLYAKLTDPFYDASPVDLEALVPDVSALSALGTAESSFFQAHPQQFPDRPLCNTGIAFLPASESVDNRILRPVVCSDSAPSGAELLDILVAEIESGAVNLAPTANSGWYDQQIYALETLLVPDRAPEADHLLLTKEYKEKLVETFKSVLIQTRETHVKQIAVINATDGGIIEEPRPFDAHPPLEVEPFPTFYLRTARAYRFVEGVLRAALGNAFVDGTSRLREDGTRGSMTLGAELADKELMLYGLHVVAADSIGAAYGLDGDELTSFPAALARTRAEAWLESWAADEDVNRDPRVSVPVAIETDPTTGQNFAVYWGVVGVKVLRMDASFPDSRRPEIVSDPGCVLDKWVPYQPYMLVEDTLELKRPVGLAPLDRDRFRALCDGAATEDQIVAAFESTP